MNSIREGEKRKNAEREKHPGTKLIIYYVNWINLKNKSERIYFELKWILKLIPQNYLRQCFRKNLLRRGPGERFPVDEAVLEAWWKWRQVSVAKEAGTSWRRCLQVDGGVYYIKQLFEQD